MTKKAIGPKSKSQDSSNNENHELRDLFKFSIERICKDILNKSIKGHAEYTLHVNQEINELLGRNDKNWLDFPGLGITEFLKFLNSFKHTIIDDFMNFKATKIIKICEANNICCQIYYHPSIEDLHDETNEQQGKDLYNCVDPNSWGNYIVIHLSYNNITNI